MLNNASKAITSMMLIGIALLIVVCCGAALAGMLFGYGS